MHTLDTLLARLEEIERDVATEMDRAPRRPTRKLRRQRPGARSDKGGTESVLGGIERELGNRVRGVLQRLDVPTRADIEGLTARIIDLEHHFLGKFRARKQRLGGTSLGKRRSNRR